jgi:hypothetical protein
VKVVRTDGSERVYQAGRGFNTDGFGDYQITDALGSLVATLKRAGVESVEIEFEG